MAKTWVYEEDVSILKEWYSKQPHLPRDIDEHYFYNFVSGTKSIELAKQKIDAYFSLRTSVINLFKNCAPGTDTFKAYCKTVGMGILPEKSPDGYRVLIAAPFDRSNFEGYNMGSHFLRYLLLIEIGLSMWPTDTSYIIIQDCGPLPMSIIKTFDLKHFQGLTKLLMRGLPMKMKKYYALNTPYFFDKINVMIRQLLSAKLNERVIVVQDDTMLKDILPKSMLPEELGGKGQSLKELDDYWNKQLESKQDWFKDRLKLVCDEGKRPKDCINRETLNFGIEGSFKTLSID